MQIYLLILFIHSLLRSRSQMLLSILNIMRTFDIYPKVLLVLLHLQNSPCDTQSVSSGLPMPLLLKIPSYSSLKYSQFFILYILRGNIPIFKFLIYHRGYLLVSTAVNFDIFFGELLLLILILIFIEMFRLLLLLLLLLPLLQLFCWLFILTYLWLRPLTTRSLPCTHAHTHTHPQQTATRMHYINHGARRRSQQQEQLTHLFFGTFEF